ncbi:hypothetical protein MF672_008045 [Actinomadura sp. ATCC 31491]|uniref:Secreted protein n=1 Tax=Actinomadura luzonensis TaxID=2805427 RepID=A0ABT0FN63_9ACTN|nr:hypothetical protein [Actinomadura luzonensis]MCK2213737.1 hypothetical protein [Actinomadura luzonensis]
MSLTRVAAMCGVALLAAGSLVAPAQAQDYDYVCLLGGQTFPPVGPVYDFSGRGCRGSGSTDVTIAAPPAYHRCRTAEITSSVTRSLWATGCVQIQG